ncbi:YdbL family protein [Opitutia bacterium ISCC 51]|nr:YdbL family protein [Opitutae bacterium ISCC 51]QXD27560.1 YdbL family protein [Opitutae bacterium ISCC 52]
MKKLTLFISLLISTFLFSSVHTFAQDEAALKQAIMQRVSSVDSIKLAGKVGENNVGLLAQRGALSSEETSLMNAENKDRKALYSILAKRLKLSLKVVGQGRAEELRKKSASGVWLQDDKGKWYKQK